MLEERDSSGNLLVRYVYSHDLISQTRPSASSGAYPSFYHYDGLGSTRALTNDNATVTDTYTYDAFGNLLDKTGMTVNTYLYTGEFFDTQSGFYYLRARYLNPANGRGGSSRWIRLLEGTAIPIVCTHTCMPVRIRVTHTPEDRNALGYVTWGADGALIGGVLAHGAWYIWLYTATAATGGFTAAQAEFLQRGQLEMDCVKSTDLTQTFFSRGQPVQGMTENLAAPHWVLELPNGWIIDPSYVFNFTLYNKIQQGNSPPKYP